MNAAYKKQRDDSLPRATILLVDDSETVSKLICSALDAQGYNVEAAVCGQEAFDWLQSLEPDLLLLDYSLPDFNGDVLIERLAEQGRDIPFVIITGHGDEKIAVEMMKLGATDYLVKDEAFMALLPAVVEQTLRSLHNQRRLLAAEEELQIAEQDLVLKESRFSELVSHMSSGVAVYEAVDNGADFVFVDLNAAAERIDGVQRDELVGRRLLKAFPAAEEIGLVSALRRVWKTGEEQFLPAALYRDERIEGWRENRIYRLPSGEVVAIYDDVTAKKQAVREVLESRRRVESLMKNIPGMAYRCRNDHIWTMEFVSEGCRKLLGCLPEEMLGGEGINYSDLIHPDDRSMVWHQVQEAIKARCAYTLEYRIRNLDGQERWVWEQGGAVYRPDGSVEAIEGLVADITASKETQLELDRRRAREGLIAEISGRFVTLPAAEAGTAVPYALQRLGGSFAVGRCYLLQFDSDADVIHQISEWCAAGVPSMQTRREGVAPDELPWAVAELSAGKVLKVPSVAVLPETAAAERRRWLDQGTLAHLGVPIRSDGTVIGLLGFDDLSGERRWSGDEERLARTAGEILGSALAKQKAELRLRQSEERFRSLFEKSNVGMTLVDVDGRFQVVNRAFCDLLGYSSEELKGLSVDDVTYPGDPNLSIRFRDGGGEVPLSEVAEKRYVGKDGKVIWTLLSTFAIPQPDGPPLVIGQVQDISERHRYEEQVLKVAEGVSAATGESFFRSLVKHLAEVLGARLVSVSEKTPDNQESMRVIALHDRGVEMGGFEYQTDGTPCDLLIRGGEMTVQQGVKELFPRFSMLEDRSFEGFVGAPIEDSKGEVIGALSAFFEHPLESPKTDESMLRIFAVRAAAELERERREEELRQERTRYKKLYQQFQAILDGIPEQISQISPKLEVLWSNRQEAMPGEGGSQLVGRRHCHEYSDEQIPFCNDCHAAKAFATGERQDALLRSGERSFGVKFFPLQDEQGRVHSVISLASDITEKKRLREETERASRLASLGEIAAGVAHEINNPNALILLNASMLTDVMETILPMLNERFLREGDFLLGKMPYSRMGEEVPRLQREVVDSAKKIRGIVEEMRGFVKQGGLVAATHLDLNDVAARTLRIVKKINPDITIESSLESTLPAVRGNGQQLEQVLINLVQNGVDALGGQSGKVSIFTGCSEEGSLVFVEVCDEGIGIPEDCLAKITDPFFTTKREEGGTGLGLSISSRIIKDHEGTLHFFSRPDKGTRVRVELPVSGRSDK